MTVIDGWRALLILLSGFSKFSSVSARIRDVLRWFSVSQRILTLLELGFALRSWLCPILLARPQRIVLQRVEGFDLLRG